MKKFLFMMCVVLTALCSCSNEDDFLQVENNSPCYLEYFMNNYYNEYRYNGESILDKRDIKKFEIKKYTKFGEGYCVLLTIDYFKTNNHGNISNMLNSIEKEMKNKYKSDDYLNFACGSTCSAIDIVCKHSQCLSKYSKYNTN